MGTTTARRSFIPAALLLVAGAVVTAANVLHLNDNARILAAEHWLTAKQAPERSRDMLNDQGPSVWYHYEALMLQAEAQARLGEWDIAAATAAQASELRPSTARPYLIQAIALARAGDYGDAFIQHLERALTLGANRPNIHQSTIALAVYHWPLWPTAAQELSIESFEFFLTNQPRVFLQLLHAHRASLMFCGVIQHRMKSAVHLCKGNRLVPRLPRQHRG